LVSCFLLIPSLIRVINLGVNSLFFNCMISISPVPRSVIN
jgi:hypothetical protein